MKTSTESKTGGQRAYLDLRRRILQLEISPGEEIDESQIAKELGISRTPIREAVIRLAAEELLTVSQNRAARVPYIDFVEVAELFDALEVCQRIAVRWAALRRTTAHIKAMREAARDYIKGTRKRHFDLMRDSNFRYHQAIGEACGNRYYKRLNDSLLTRSLPLAQLTFTDAPTSEAAYNSYFETVNREHEQIVDFVEQKNPDGAEDMLRDHIRQFRIRSLDYVSRNLADTIRLRPSKARR
jgi:DNA-binding GntR family transcriptional regulator